MRKILLLLFLLTFSFLRSYCQWDNIAELLGYEADAKLLIMHADDLGVAHSVNKASVAAFNNGGISSASIMVPCPWFSEIAEYSRQNPEICLGLHLTLTSEWKYYKWDGVSSSDKISSLLNEEGVFHDKVIDFVLGASLEEVEIEVRAQIDKALNAGVNVSHLDSHMGSLFATPELFEIYVRLGNEYQLPVMVPRDRIPPSWNIEELMGPIHYPLDNLIMMGQMATDWQKMYDDMIDKIIPGLNEIIVHLGYDDAEMQAIMVDKPDFGAEWRQKDLDYVTSEHYHEKLQQAGIHLVTWRQVRNALIQSSKELKGE